jgi:hypothetical protein
MPAGAPMRLAQTLPVPEPPVIVSCTPVATPLYRLFASATAGAKQFGCGGETMVKLQHAVDV